MIWAEARRRVEETTASINGIGTDLGIRPIVLWRRAQKEGWLRPEGAPPSPVLAAAARRGRRVGDLRAGQHRGADPRAVSERLLRAVERQIRRIERRMRKPSAETEEKDARMLGTLARTLATLTALDRDDGAAANGAERRDRDELNAELARRIARWAEGGEEPR